MKQISGTGSVLFALAVATVPAHAAGKPPLAMYSTVVKQLQSGDNLVLPNASGSGTQCLQADNAGNVTGTGSACGSGGGGTSPVFFLNPSAASASSESDAAIGNIATPSQNLTLVALGAVLTTVTGGVYDLCVAPYNSSSNEIAASPTCTPSYTETSGTANKNIYEAFASPFSMSAGTTYIVFFVRTDSTTTISQTINFSGPLVSGPGVTFPASGTAKVLASTSPTTGQAWSSGGSGVWTIQLVYHL